jgi:hypothetical protein
MKKVSYLDLESYKKLIVKTRNKMIRKPKEIVLNVFKESPYYDKEREFFLGHASEILHYLRRNSWNKFQTQEKLLNSEVYKSLIENDLDIVQFVSQNQNSSLTKEDIQKLIIHFLDRYDAHFYEQSKSNTNSRRSRAGKEFEFIMETILLRSVIMFDNQGVIGSKIFKTEKLGKLVDCVVPGVAEYEIEKRKCALISMKTSLRERWQEVPEELKRTGAQEMFLLTLDEGVSKNTIESLSSHNITLVVPDDVKESKYDSYHSVYGLTQFLFELKERCGYWLNRKNLGKHYYEKKIETLKIRLENVSCEYEKEILESLKDYFQTQLN